MQPDKGILIYPELNGDSEILADAFFAKLLNERMYLTKSKNLDRSHIMASKILRDQHELLLPNLFVISNANDKFFSWADYESKLSQLDNFLKGKGKLLNLKNIPIASKFEEFIYANYSGGKLQFAADLIDHPNATSHTRGFCMAKLVNKIDVDQVIKNSSEFAPLVNVLFA